jgi:hypothetical protein
MASVKLMISHAHEDKEIAAAWGNLIGSLFGDGTGIWYSSAPAYTFDGYKLFATQIENRIREADAVLTLQTPYSTEKPWVVWEAGLARGTGKPLIIVVYKVESGKLGNPLDGFDQKDGLNEEEVENILLQLTEYSNVRRGYTGRVFRSAWESYKEAVESATDKMLLSEPVRYDKRLILSLPVAVATKRPIADLPLILEELTVRGENGLKLFGEESKGGAKKWSQFRRELLDRDKRRTWPGSASGWTEVLEQTILLVLTDSFNGSKSLPLYYDEDEKIAYRPSISSRLQKNQSVEITVSFNQLPAEITARPVGKCGIISHLLDFCRMFRWGVLQNPEFEHLFNDDLPKHHASEAYAEFLRCLTNIRIDFQNRGLRKDDLIDAFPAKDQAAVGKILREYYETTEAMDPRNNPSPDEVAKGYRKMLRVNKEFYKAAASAYAQCIEKTKG